MNKRSMNLANKFHVTKQSYKSYRIRYIFHFAIFISANSFHSSIPRNSGCTYKVAEESPKKRPREERRVRKFFRLYLDSNHQEEIWRLRICTVKILVEC